MKGYWRSVCICLLASLAIIVTGLSGQAETSSGQDTTRWMKTGDTFTVSGFFFDQELLSGECSRDCYDLDLALYGADIQVPIVEDSDRTSTPSIEVPYEGRFTLEVSMTNCARPGGCRTSISSDQGF